MGQKLTPPDIRSMVREAIRRIDLLERRLSNLAKRKTVLDIPFSRDGAVDLAVSSPYYLADPGGTVFEIVVSLRVAATSGTTTVVLLRNGLEVASITLTAGQTTRRVKNLAITYTGNQDRMNVEITTAGTDAAGLTAQVRTKIAA